MLKAPFDRYLHSVPENYTEHSDKAKQYSTFPTRKQPSKRKEMQRMTQV